MVLVKILRSHWYGCVDRNLSNEKVQEYKDAISDKYPHLKDVYCVADGVKLLLESTDNDLVVAGCMTIMLRTYLYLLLMVPSLVIVS